MKAHCERVEAEKNKYRVLLKLFKVLRERVEEKINKLEINRYDKTKTLLELKRIYSVILKDIKVAWS